MEFLFGIGGSFFQLLVLLAIIAAVVMFVRRRREGTGDDPGIGTLRRLYYYGLSFVALMFSAGGAVMLVDYVADSFGGRQILSRGESQLALALAITIVGTPIWLFHWWLGTPGCPPVPLGDPRG